MTQIEAKHQTVGITSPFLPGTKVQYAWDSTSLGYLKTCPRLYQYVMIDGWGSGEESIHLRFGQEYHSALESFDRFLAEGIDRSVAIRETIHLLLKSTVDFQPDETTRAGKYKNRRSLLRMVIDYLDHYSPDPAQTLILENGDPAVELSFRFELDWGPQAAGGITVEGISGAPEIAAAQPYLLSGHLDRVVIFNDDLFVMDRKTSTTTLSDYYFANFDPNNQMTLYSLAAQIVLGTTIKGVIIDAAQVLVDDSRFVRRFTYRTQDQLDEWLEDLERWLRLAEGYATEGYWPMNDTACGMYGGCRFREICSKSPQVRERFLATKFKQLPEEERWNPLRAR